LPPTRTKGISASPQFRPQKAFQIADCRLQIGLDDCRRSSRKLKPQAASSDGDLTAKTRIMGPGEVRCQKLEARSKKRGRGVLPPRHKGTKRARSKSGSALPAALTSAVPRLAPKMARVRGVCLTRATAPALSSMVPARGHGNDELSAGVPACQWSDAHLSPAIGASRATKP